MTRIKELREAQGIKQLDLAKFLNVTQGTLSNWERDIHDPDKGSLFALALKFNVSIDYILGKPNTPSSPRAIRVPVLGRIPAGIPLEAIEDVEDWEEIPADEATGGHEYFALRIQGDSMLPEYRSNDVVIFLKADTCNSGDECAVMVNGEDATFKKVIRKESGIVLQPLNTAYEPDVYTNEQIESLPVKVIGVAIELRRKK
jgi:repressor LexA